VKAETEFEASLAGWLAELSLKTLERAEGGLLEVPEGLEEPSTFNPPEALEVPNPGKLRVFRVEPSSRVRVAAIDVACKRLGFLGEGVVCAVRGALVWRDEYAYHYCRYGPYTFHLKDGWVFQALGETLPRSLEASLNPLGLTAKIQMLVERELQLQACKTFRNSLILLDGSLSVITGMGGSLSERLSEALERARANGNRVLALAKNTKILQGEILNLALRLKPPCLIQVEAEGRGNLKNLGRVFLAKLDGGLPGFRLDVDAGLSLEEALEAVGSLLASDLLVQGYPETLRMAHMLSVFTPLDVLAIQRFLAENFGVRVRRERSVRRMLFGPYAGWEEAGS